MSSIEPDECSGEIDAGQEVDGALVVASGDGTELFDPAEEIFDQVSGFVEVLVVGALDLSVALGWDHRGFAGRPQGFDHALIGVVSLVGQEG